MWNLLGDALLGVGMFWLGWAAHARLAPAPLAAEAEEALEMERWQCPACRRGRELPPSLKQRVIVCNNCQVRLVRADG